MNSMAKTLIVECPTCKTPLPVVSDKQSIVRVVICKKCGDEFQYSAWLLVVRNDKTFYKIEFEKMASGHHGYRLEENAMSRYDYRDPGTDPAYCNGISDRPAHDGNYCLQCGERCADNPVVDGAHYPYCSGACMSADQQRQSNDIPAIDEDDLTIIEPCAWCGEPVLTFDWHPYCSSQCGLYAEMDG